MLILLAAAIIFLILIFIYEWKTYSLKEACLTVGLLLLLSITVSVV